MSTGRPAVGRGAPVGIPEDEEITRPEGVAAETSWGRLASVLSDLSPRESREAVTLVINWSKCSIDRRVLLSALSHELKSLT